MATLTLEQQRDALRAARASGVQTVRYGDHSITYKSDAEMAAALVDLDRRIAAATGDRPRHAEAVFGRSS